MFLHHCGVVDSHTLNTSTPSSSTKNSVSAEARPTRADSTLSVKGIPLFFTEEKDSASKTQKTGEQLLNTLWIPFHHGLPWLLGLSKSGNVLKFYKMYSQGFGKSVQLRDSFEFIINSTTDLVDSSRLFIGFGGKGANQAVMCAKCGANVSIICKLGQDAYGHSTLKNFKSYGIDQGIFYCDDPLISSGLAPITVDEHGANTVVIIGGSNDRLTLEEISSCSLLISQSQLLVVQLELPVQLSLHAMKLAKKFGTPVILNPAPAIPDLDPDFFVLSDILCPNESELAILTGEVVDSIDDAVRASKLLLEKYKGLKVLTTLGKGGCLFVTEDKTIHVPLQTKDINVVDTVGAGDCFIGAFSFCFARGLDIESCMQAANSAASLSVTKPGTQSSYPTLEELKSANQLFQ